MVGSTGSLALATGTPPKLYLAWAEAIRFKPSWSTKAESMWTLCHWSLPRSQRGDSLAVYRPEGPCRVVVV